MKIKSILTLAIIVSLASCSKTKKDDTGTNAAAESFSTKINGVLFIDDYAHHPNEIKATLAAARERFPESKIRVVFQPHRYSRVRDLLDSFLTCFDEADLVVMTDVSGGGRVQIFSSEGCSFEIVFQGREHTVKHFDSK